MALLKNNFSYPAVVLLMVKMIHLAMIGWINILSVTNSRTNATNSAAKLTNTIANLMNSIVNETKFTTLKGNVFYCNWDKVNYKHEEFNCKL